MSIKTPSNFIENFLRMVFMAFCHGAMHLDSSTVLHFCLKHTSLPHYHAIEVCWMLLSLAIPNCVAMKIDVTAWDV